MTSLFVSPALAGDSVSTLADFGSGSGLLSFLPILLVMFVFYFLVIRPQSERIKEHRKLIDGLKKGDKVIMTGGLIATVTRSVEGSDEIALRIAEGVEVTALRTGVLSLRRTPTDPANDKK